MPRARAPHDVAAIRRTLTEFLNSADETGAKPCNAKCGVYVFYDYDGEPIYVGRTHERLRGRMLRHLTNQRSDAVAMNVLDPFEVADVEVYPFYDLEQPRPGESDNAYKKRVRECLSGAEYTVFLQVLEQSRLKAVLNEKEIRAGGSHRTAHAVSGAHYSSRAVRDTEASRCEDRAPREHHR